MISMLTTVIVGIAVVIPNAGRAILMNNINNKQLVTHTYLPLPHTSAKFANQCY